jgi:DNA-binding GntR family transcriptional regulator
VKTDGQSYFQQEGDVDFHYRIIKGSHNQHLLAILGGELYHLLRMYGHQFGLTSNRPKLALKEHNRICKAISERNAELVELLMRHHINHVRINIMQYIETVAG